MSVTRKDIFNKFVIDVGCGNGRWSYAFRKLGAKVVACDFTRNGCRETKKMGVEVVMADVLHPPFMQRTFDIVYSFGVLHHTGNLQKAFSENAKLAKPGGMMHVYLYKKKGLRLRIWRLLIHSIPHLKMKEAVLNVFLEIRSLTPYLGKVIPYSSLHGGFDALSPTINTESDEHFVRWLFQESKFNNIVRVKPKWCNWKADIHMRGVRE